MYISLLSLILLVLAFAVHSWLRTDATSTAPVTWESLRDRREIEAAHTAWKARRRLERQQHRLAQQQARPHVYGLSPVVARLAWRKGFRTYWRFTHDLARCGSDWQARLAVLLAYAEHLKV